MTGKDLSDWIRRRGIKQVEIAERLGMSQPTFSAVTRSPDVKSGILERIAAALGCKVSELYGEAPSGNVNASGDNSTAVGGNYSQVNSAKLIDEVAALIERYRGEKGLLRMRDRYRSARDYTQHLNKGLKQLIEGEPFSSLSTYWARHSWASIAYNELGAPIDTISAALGHKYGSRVTAVYVNPDQQRVDELNRRMMDLVFGGPVTDSITGKSIRGTR